MPDKHLNFSYSTVATAPSPATTGTSLVVAASTGTYFPAVPFNAVIWPAGARAVVGNAEIVRVTAKSVDTFTIVRAQESTSARSVIVGDQIAAAITSKTLTDVENKFPAYGSGLYYVASPIGSASALSNNDSIVLNHVYGVGPVPLRAGTLLRVGVIVSTGVSTSVVRLGLYTDGGGYPGTLVADFGTVATDTTGTKEITISQAVNDANYYFVAAAQVASGVGLKYIPPSYIGSWGFPFDTASPTGANAMGSWDGDSATGALNSIFIASPPPSLSNAHFPLIFFRY